MSIYVGWDTLRLLCFSTVPNGCEKHSVLETTQFAKLIAVLRLLRRTLLLRKKVLIPTLRQNKKDIIRCPFYFGGESGIRTHGCFHIAGFQDRFLKPLGHLSKQAGVSAS